MLTFLSSQSPLIQWLIFLAENVFVAALALLFGHIILKIYKKPIKAPTRNEWLVCGLTNIVNTTVTFCGFWLWLKGFIIFDFAFNWMIIPDLFLLFMTMDLAMYIFHYIIHHTFLYNIIHRFHHKYEDPIPIDLFVLHPLETVSFGSLWLVMLFLYHFNIYAATIYLVLNVIFGIIGHLGMDKPPVKISKTNLFKYLGTSSFHHRHHLEVNYNFGFYTNIWDKLFGTYKP